MARHQNEISETIQLEPASERSRFIDSSSIKRLILAAVDYRVDETGKVKPETAVRVQTYDKFTDQSFLRGARSTYERHGTLIRASNEWHETKDADGNSYIERPHKLAIDSLLYSALKGDVTINLSEADLERLEHDTKRLTDASLEKGYSCKLSLEQEKPAYHINNPDKSGVDFSPTRIYVPGSKSGTEIAANVIRDDSVEISRAKVWVPRNYGGEQKFRSDTPIFIVTNYSQLGSIVSKLSNMNQQGQLPITKHVPLAGSKIEGLPGVVIGQETVEGRSFNGGIQHLFTEPVETALLENNLETGEPITDEWLDRVARRVEELAQQTSADHGVNPDNHAFGIGEPADKIMRVAEEAAKL